MQNETKKTAYSRIPIWIVCFAAVLFFFYRCPMEYFLGIPCPGCGMSRALLALVRFDFAQAFYYHPLIWLVLVVAVCWILERLHITTFSEKFRQRALLWIGILFILVYIVRLCSGSPIVHMHIRQSVLGRLFFGG